MSTLLPGQMLAGTSYQVVREIGAGGMGVVYEVEHVRLKKRYVTKVIHEQIKNEDGALKRMEREAQVLAGISHPNIVQVHDFGASADGVTYFVMDKLDGVDLRRLMKRSVPRLQAMGIIADVLEALDHVHRRGIVHRDIKPENIFLAEQVQGTVTKVLDFGIVSIVDGDGRISQGRITKTGGFVGTLYYAAPEQMQGKPPGPANDVYAAALVLFEMLVGKGPFDDDPGVGLSRCFKPAPRLIEMCHSAEMAARIPPELNDAVARALDQEPSRRPTAGVFASELRSIRLALKNAPGGAEEDMVRAEVDDLLAQFVPSQGPRPAAGSPMMSSGHAGAGGGGVGNPSGNPSPAEGTAVPPTPVMPGAPGRVPANAFSRGGSFDATMASPEGVPPSPQQHHPSNNAMASAPANPNAFTGSTPKINPTSLGLQGGVGTPNAFAPHGQAHSATAPPPSPRFPPNTGTGPQFTSSPGVYATITTGDPLSTRTPSSAAPWAAIAGGAAALVLVGLVAVGAYAWREKASSSSAGPSSSSNATTTTTTTTTTTATPTAVASHDMAPPSEPDPIPTPSVSASSTAAIATPATTTTTTTATAAAQAKPINPKPPTPIAPTPATPTPRPTNSTRNAEKDGYVKTL